MTPVEGARVESARRGRPVDGPGEVQFAGTPVLPVPFPPAGGASPAGHQAGKLKLSAVLDPTLDAEIQPLSSEKATRIFPTADSNVSMDQLAAVRQVVASGGASSVHAVRGLICTRGQGPRLYTRNGFAVCTSLFL